MLSDLPTINSLGFSDFEITNWYGVFVSAGTHASVVDQLNKAVNTALAAPEGAARLDDMGSSKIAGSRKDFDAFIKKEFPRWEMLVKKSNAKID